MRDGLCLVSIAVPLQVSEGLVHVTDPPLHSRGNFLDSVVELDRRLLDYIVGLDTEINELVDGSVRPLSCDHHMIMLSVSCDSCDCHVI